MHIEKLPYSIRVLLECCVRTCDEFAVKSADVEKILNWSENCKKDVDIPFKPSRVLMQDFTYVLCCILKSFIYIYIIYYTYQ